MNNKQKVIELIKRLLASGSVKEVPGSFHEHLLAATPEERAALQEGARGMSEEELELARAEFAREAGAEGAEAADLVLQALRESRGGGEGRAGDARWLDELAAEGRARRGGDVWGVVVLVVSVLVAGYVAWEAQGWVSGYLEGRRARAAEEEDIVRERVAELKRVKEQIAAAEEMLARERATPAALAARGEALFKSKACHACHSVDGSRLVGPTMKGIKGRKVKLTDGSELYVDEEYFARAITDPQAQVVAGYPPVMPSYLSQLSDDEMSALWHYAASIR